MVTLSPCWRLAESAHYFRQSGDEFVEHGGLVVSWKASALTFMAWLGFALLKMISASASPCARMAERGLGFGYRALTLGAGERFILCRSISACFSTVAMSSRSRRAISLLYFHLSLALHLLHLTDSVMTCCCMMLVSIS